MIFLSVLLNWPEPILIFSGNLFTEGNDLPVKTGMNVLIHRKIT